ncbi:DNRLRE domain-containing protein [Streptomyces platensis]|uniref:CBM96 family carbohydrate-binding protein n=1 Tax=Streptomyces platensis TaxID=58346 RepID=UPI002E15F7FC|nr:DNRLRE domain-containing protein [Streptomyces platensis]WTI56332.1 DNRLRE domain-containing protein [Streptomyces platensis]WUB78182.1 DNRLRE domain-containing protein [Streptomyces platensis]
MPTRPDLNVSFYDHLDPKATAGVYTIAVEHRLTKGGVRVDAGAELPKAVDSYEIRAAQFVLDPSSVHATFPPTGAVGRYTHVLPHLTLSRAILPWERQLLGRAAKAPWLALLVFAAGELDDDPDAQGEFTTRPISELREPGLGINGPKLSGTIDGDNPCRTIDLPVSVFHAIVPREDELFKLVHMRDVRTAPQRRDNGEILTEGEYAVLAANRFPRTPGSYAVHLVSLEGWLGRLAPGTLPATEKVRLCSLWSWHFTNDPEGSLDPAGLLRNLVAPGHTDPENFALRLAPIGDPSDSPEVAHARTRLHHGYTAVAYRTLAGEDTYAWYRGPLTPLTAPELPVEAVEGPHTTADHALIYDHEYGLFDVSYAAAWTLGRAIALADPDYSSEVVQARREMANRAAALLVLSSDPARAGADPAEPVGTAALRELAVPGFGRRLVQALRAPVVQGPPPAPATRTARREPGALLAEPRAQQSLLTVAQDATPTVPDWLERLALLNGVPFAHLVPDPRTLPPESLRAFRIDPAWIHALVAGAGDVGAHTSLDRDLHPVLTERISRTGATLPVAGLLINSELVHAWPVFDILATTADGEPVGELRRDHLAPDVLLVLWDGVPDQIAIREPGQGIHFGINSEERISLRHLTGNRVGYPTDTEFPDPGLPDSGTVFDYLRTDSVGELPDVLRLSGEDGLLAALSAACLPSGRLTPGQFALELVNAPLEQLLLPPTVRRDCVADTFAKYGSEAEDFGTTNPLLVKNEGPTNSVTRITYLRFDTTQLPPPDQLGKVLLRVYATAQDAGDFDLKAYATDNDWDESTLSWSERPELPANPIATAYVSSGDAWVWLEFDLTEHLRRHTGDELSVALSKEQGGNKIVRITSRESDTNRPHLSITVTQPSPNSGEEHP